MKLTKMMSLTQSRVKANRRSKRKKRRGHGVLMSKIGEHDNVLKLRPPLCFSKDNADQLVETLDRVLEAA